MLLEFFTSYLVVNLLFIPVYYRVLSSVTIQELGALVESAQLCAIIAGLLVAWYGMPPTTVYRQGNGHQLWGG